MGVYIDMEMPKSFINVRIYSDGRVISQSFSKFGEQIATAVPVQPHGRLIDADEIKTAFPCGESVRTECVRATIDNAPTVIEAEEGET